MAAILPESPALDNGWTVSTLKALLDERAVWQLRVDGEREKALKIKEEADKTALSLDREIRAYKDEKANQLREQISSERGLYALKTDLGTMSDRFSIELRPILDFVSKTAGKSDGIRLTTGNIVSILGALGILFTLYTQLRGH